MSPGPTSFRYLIVGGGMAADAAARGIRAEDERGSILLLTREAHPPYDRPPLSKGLWEDESEDRIWRETSALGVDVRTGMSVVRLDVESGEAWDETGRSYAFDRLLLATGAEPRRLAGPDPGVVYFRTLDDYRSVRSRISGGGRAAVLGGGFIGCELASALRSAEVDVSLHFPEGAPLGFLLPGPFPDLLGRVMAEAGVSLRPGTLVRGTKEDGRGFRLLVERDSDGGDSLEGPFSLVVAGLGVSPNEELAREAGLKVDDGIVVDPSLRTSHSRAWAAGDVARCPFPFLGGTARVEHEDHANESGILAGRAMAGAEVAYDAVPYFYSEVFGLSIEALGEVAPGGDPEVLEPDAPSAPGAAIFRRDGRVRGVLLWNLKGKAIRLRKLLRSTPTARSREIASVLGL